MSHDAKRLVPLRTWAKIQTKTPRFHAGDIVMGKQTCLVARVTSDIRQFPNGDIEYRLSNKSLYREKDLVLLCGRNLEGCE